MKGRREIDAAQINGVSFDPFLIFHPKTYDTTNPLPEGWSCISHKSHRIIDDSHTAQQKTPHRAYLIFYAFRVAKQIQNLINQIKLFKYTLFDISWSLDLLY